MNESNGAKIMWSEIMNESNGAKINIGKLDVTILSILRNNKELSGRDMQNEIIDKQSFVALATIYCSIRRLEKQGYIEMSRIGESYSKKGGRPKIYFKITSNGIKVLVDYIKDMENVGLFTAAVDLVSAQIYRLFFSIKVYFCSI